MTINEGGARKAIAGALIVIVCLVAVCFIITRGGGGELPPGWNTSSGAFLAFVDNKGVTYTAAYPSDWVGMTLDEISSVTGWDWWGSDVAGFRSPIDNVDSVGVFIFYPASVDNDLAQFVSTSRNNLNQLIDPGFVLSATLLEDKDISVGGRPGHQFVVRYTFDPTRTSREPLKIRAVLTVVDRPLGPYRKVGFIMLCSAEPENAYESYSSVFDTMVDQLKIY